jgi:hypothetical protein
MLPLFHPCFGGAAANMQAVTRGFLNANDSLGSFQPLTTARMEACQPKRQQASLWIMGGIFAGQCTPAEFRHPYNACMEYVGFKPWGRSLLQTGGANLTNRNSLLLQSNHDKI